MSLARCAVPRLKVVPQQHMVLRRRAYSGDASPAPTHKQPSRHARFYSDIIPGMLSVGLLGSAVYLGLRLLQAELSQEHYLNEARARVQELEKEVETLRKQQLAEHAATAAATALPAETKKRSWF